MAITKNFRDGALTWADGAGTPVTGTLKSEQGDISIEVPGHETVEYLDRGEHASTPEVRKTNAGVVNWSLTMYMREFTEEDAVTPHDLKFFVGTTGSTLTSTLGANADVNTLKYTLTIEGTDFGDAGDHTYVFDHTEIISFTVTEGDPNIWSMNMRSYLDKPALS